MRIAVDTNVLVYAEGFGDRTRVHEARGVLDRFPPGSLIVPVQVLGEVFRVLVGKAKRPASEAWSTVSNLRLVHHAYPTTVPAFERAIDLASTHGLQIWDAIVIAAAAEGGCRLLLSEDLQHGATLGGVTVIDPFRDPPHPLLTAALSHAR